MNDILLAFSLTLIAGLSTGIGSAIAFFAKKTNTKFLSISLGFSAGVMIYVSTIEIFSEARNLLTSELGTKTGYLITVISFFLGMLVIALIDKLIPSAENPHEVFKVEEIENNCAKKNAKLLRTGIFIAFAITIHNFPEGIAAFISSLQHPKLAIPVILAISIHNIPEGIAVSFPIYYATGSRKKAFLFSFLSGLSEPLGALVGYLILMPFINNVVFGIVFAAVAGIMVFISLDELLPSAEEYGEHHLCIYGLVSGMIIMSISILLFM
ncbi:MAG: zinc transporter ZupT [Caloramator sp.]|nr:zinc transporter ZupT [Caloramator sp.]